jgi:hypothetical protein
MTMRLVTQEDQGSIWLPCPIWCAKSLLSLSFPHRGLLQSGMLKAIHSNCVCACLACGNPFHFESALAPCCRVFQNVDGGIKAFILEEDRIVSGVPSRMLKLSRDFVKFLRVLIADQEKYVCWMISILHQCSRQVKVFTGLLRSWRSLGLTLVAVSDNDGFLVVSLLKALFGDWIFSRVKTHDLS